LSCTSPLQLGFEGPGPLRHHPVCSASALTLPHPVCSASARCPDGPGVCVPPPTRLHQLSCPLVSAPPTPASFYRYADPQPLPLPLDPFSSIPVALSSCHAQFH
jgi:hypothetical protein